ncbi:hypothetical protein ACFL0W_05930 [Nanoarchaeota archaeon]
MADSVVDEGLQKQIDEVKDKWSYVKQLQSKGKIYSATTRKYLETFAEEINKLYSESSFIKDLMKFSGGKKLAKDIGKLVKKIKNPSHKPKWKNVVEPLLSEFCKVLTVEAEGKSSMYLQNLVLESGRASGSARTSAIALVAVIGIAILIGAFLLLGGGDDDDLDDLPVVEDEELTSEEQQVVDILESDDAESKKVMLTSSRLPVGFRVKDLGLSSAELQLLYELSDCEEKGNLCNNVHNLFPDDYDEALSEKCQELIGKENEEICSSDKYAVGLGDCCGNKYPNCEPELFCSRPLYKLKEFNEKCNGGYASAKGMCTDGKEDAGCDLSDDCVEGYLCYEKTDMCVKNSGLNGDPCNFKFEEGIGVTHKYTSLILEEDTCQEPYSCNPDTRKCDDITTRCSMDEYYTFVGYTEDSERRYGCHTRAELDHCCLVAEKPCADGLFCRKGYRRSNECVQGSENENDWGLCRPEEEKGICTGKYDCEKNQVCIREEGTFRGNCVDSSGNLGDSCSFSFFSEAPGGDTICKAPLVCNVKTKKCDTAPFESECFDIWACKPPGCKTAGLPYPERCKADIECIRDLTYPQLGRCMETSGELNHPCNPFINEDDCRRYGDTNLRCDKDTSTCQPSPY